MNLNKLQELILNKQENPEKRKAAFEEYINNLPDDYSPFLTKVSTCDSSILRFRARKLLDNPDLLAKNKTAAPSVRPALKLDNIKSLKKSQAVSRIKASSAGDSGASKRVSTADVQKTFPNDETSAKSSFSKKSSPGADIVSLLSSGPENDSPANKNTGLSKKQKTPEKNKKENSASASKKENGISASKSANGFSSSQGMGKKFKSFSKFLFLTGLVAAIYFVSQYLMNMRNRINEPAVKLNETEERPQVSHAPVEAPTRLPYKSLYSEALEQFNAENYLEAREFIEEAVIAAKEQTISEEDAKQLYLLMARIQLKEKKYSAALESLELADRKEPVVSFLRAKAYNGLNRPEKALDLTEIYLEQCPGDAKALIAAYDYSVILGKDEKKIKYLTVLNDVLTDNIHAVLRIAEHDHEEKNFAHLIQITDPFATGSGTYPAIYYYRAKAFKALKQNKKSIANYEIYLRITKKTLDANGLYDLAIQCISINNINKAFYYYRQAAEMDGEILIKSDMGILDEARTRFETLFSLTPEDPHIISELAWTEYLSGNLERSKLLFTDLQARAKAQTHRETAAEMLSRLTNISISMASAEPDNNSTNETSLTENTSENESSTADSEYSGSTSEDARTSGKDDEPIVNKVQGDMIVIEKITPSQEILPEDLDEADQHIDNAVTLYDNKEYDRALEEYENAIELNPYSPEAHLKAGKICQNKLKNFDDAVYFYKKYLALEPDDQNVYMSISEILIKEKRFKEALPWVNTAINKDPDNENVPYCKNLKNLVKRKLSPNN